MRQQKRAKLLHNEIVQMVEHISHPFDKLHGGIALLGVTLQLCHFSKLGEMLLQGDWIVQLLRYPLYM